MSLSPIEYEVDGIKLTGWLGDGSVNAPAPGILVAHEALGVNAHVKDRTKALQDLGYVAFALDLYGESDLSVPEAFEQHSRIMDAPGLVFRRAEAALRLLSALPAVDSSRLAAIGFCQGGMTALELARGGASIQCAVGFHPGLTRPAGSRDEKIKAKVLMMIGDADPFVTKEHRNTFAEEMNAAAADWQLHIFGKISHNFTNPSADSMGVEGFAYSETATKRAWQMMLGLFDETFGPRRD